jgi:hypothetical protein
LDDLFRKVGDLTKRPFDWSADVAKVQARTLLVFADADAIRPEHMVEFWKALGGGQRDAGIDGSLRPANQLAIVPNATHHTLAIDPMLPEIVERFLGTEEGSRSRRGPRSAHGAIRARESCVCPCPTNKCS